MTNDPVRVAVEFALVLEGLEIPYLVGGGVASTLHGEPRATLDVDFAMHLDVGRSDALCRALEPGFYVDREGLREASSSGGHFNVLHRETKIKVDGYARPREGLHAEEIRRAERRPLARGTAEVRVATAEDVVLQKLRWYRLGDCVSDRQWRDVVGVLKLRGQELDARYMDRWARELELADLLNEARREAGLEA